MLKLKKIAVTGGLASGKTSVCRIFQRLGAYIVDSDEIVHNLLSPDSILGKKIIELLGNEIVENGLFNRKKIAEKVFNDQKKLKQLELLIHPIVFHEIDLLYHQIEKQKKYSLFIVEIPLLYETGFQGAFDYVITVMANDKDCKTRLASKGLSPHDYEKRMQRQLLPQAKAKRADFVLHNDGSIEDLEKQVELLFPQLTK